MDFITKCKNISLYAAQDKEMFTSVYANIQRDNRKSLMVYSVLGGIMFLILSVASLASSALRFPSWGFLIISLLMLGMALSCRYLLPSHPAWTGLLIWFFELLLFTLGILLSLSHPEFPAVTLVALLFVIPIMFFLPPYQVTILIFSVLAIFLCISHQVKSPAVWAMDLWNGLCMATLSIPISTNLSILKVRVLHEADRADYLSHVDVLTGTKNRNCYEKDLKEYANTSYTFIYADVNGLHAKNNTEGHEAGDAMLKEVTRQMKASLGKEYVYRVGGDEFVAIVPLMPQERVEKIIADLIRILLNQEIHVAFGYANGKKGEDIIEVQKKAEAMMYKNKRSWYEQPEHNRRKR